MVNRFIDNSHDHQLSNLKFVSTEQEVSTKTEDFLEKRGGHWQANYGLMSLMTLMLEKNLILEGDVNFLVKAAATYNYSPNLYELFRTNRYQKGHDQHHVIGSYSEFYFEIWVIHICWISGGPGERDIAVE